MITLNEILENESGAFFVKVRPDDSLSRFSTEEEGLRERLLGSIPPKYRFAIIGFDGANGRYVPRFSEDAQKEWDKEYDNYISRKAEWCQKYGCE